MLTVVMSVVSIAALSPPNAICYRLASSMMDRCASVSLYHAIDSDTRIQHSCDHIVLYKLVTGLAFEMVVSTPIKRLSRGSSSTRRSNQHRRLAISPCAASTASIVLTYCSSLYRIHTDRSLAPLGTRTTCNTVVEQAFIVCNSYRADSPLCPCRLPRTSWLPLTTVSSDTLLVPVMNFKFSIMGGNEGHGTPSSRKSSPVGR